MAVKVGVPGDSPIAPLNVILDITGFCVVPELKPGTETTKVLIGPLRLIDMTFFGSVPLIICVPPAKVTLPAYDVPLDRLLTVNDTPSGPFHVPMGNSADVTVSVLVPVIDPEVAVIVVDPAATAVARPLVATVATGVLDELQITELVRSCVEPSE